MLCRYNFTYSFRDKAGDVPYTLDIKEYIYLIMVMTMYKTIVKEIDVTNYIRDLTWRDSIDTLGVEVSFELAVNKFDKNLSFLYDITLGDPVQNNQ